MFVYVCRFAFKKLIKELYKECTWNTCTPLPSDASLSKLFFLADTDKNGLVNEKDFLVLFELIISGTAEGLASAGGSAAEGEGNGGSPAELEGASGVGSGAASGATSARSGSSTADAWAAGLVDDLAEGFTDGLKGVRDTFAAAAAAAGSLSVQIAKSDPYLALTPLPRCIAKRAATPRWPRSNGSGAADDENINHHPRASSSSSCPVMGKGPPPRPRWPPRKGSDDSDADDDDCDGHYSNGFSAFSSHVPASWRTSTLRTTLDPDWRDEELTVDLELPPVAALRAAQRGERWHPSGAVAAGGGMAREDGEAGKAEKGAKKGGGAAGSAVEAKSSCVGGAEGWYLGRVALVCMDEDRFKASDRLGSACLAVADILAGAWRAFDDDNGEKDNEDEDEDEDAGFAVAGEACRERVLGGEFRFERQLCAAGRAHGLVSGSVTVSVLQGAAAAT